MRLAVTGTSGQVVTALLERGPAAGVEIVALGRPALDLARPETIAPALAAARADAVVSAAAWTAVDKAEDERDAAFAVNAEGAGAVAAAAAALGLPVVHLSTDYVFPGTLDRPYTEADATGPTGVYGASKLEGERRVAAANADHAVLRTAWVYAPFGHNFVRTMLRVGEARPEVSVVADQIGNPTSALDIADGVVAVARNLLARPGDAGLRGVFHMTGEGEASWADFAEAVFAEAERHGRAAVAVRRIATADYPTRAARPANSRLDCARLAARHGVRCPAWRGSLAGVVRRLLTT